MSNEAFDRNQTLQIIHNTKLPSYSLWDIDSIEEASFNTNAIWWKQIKKLYHKNKLTNKDTEKTILKWIKFYNITEEPIKEYCSKRNGDHLYCDI